MNNNSEPDNGLIESVNASNLVNQLIAKCKAAGMSRTRGLESVLRAFAESTDPLDVGSIMRAVRGRKIRLDTATPYRLVERLEKCGIVRRVGAPLRKAHYALCDGGHVHHYLIDVAQGTIRSASAGVSPDGYQSADHIEVLFFYTKTEGQQQ